MELNELNELAADMVRELFDYCPESGILTHRKPRQRVTVGREAGVINTHGYRQVMIKGKSYLTHRLVWLYVHGEWPKDQIDHIDGNPSNNRISNLRGCTHRENQQNRKKSVRNTTGYVGVCFDKSTGKYQAQIRANGKVKYLGLFTDPEEAATAYVIAKAQYHTFNPVVRETKQLELF